MGILKDLKDFMGIKSPRNITQEEQTSYEQEIGKMRAQETWRRAEEERKRREAHVKKLQKYGFRGVCEGKV